MATNAPLESVISSSRQHMTDVTDSRPTSGDSLLSIEGDYRVHTIGTPETNIPSPETVKKISRLESTYTQQQETGAQDSGIEDEARDGEKTEEELDKSVTLPKGWPHLHELLFRRKALFVRKPVSVSIERAIEQLQKLQDRLEEWSKEMEVKILSIQSSSVQGESSKGGGGNLPPSLLVPKPPQRSSTNQSYTNQKTFFTEPGNSRRQIRFSAKSPEEIERSLTKEVMTSPNAQSLSIQGIGAVIKEEEEEEEEEEITAVRKAVRLQEAVAVGDAEELPRLGAEEVIEEVVNLVGRLEADRSDTVGAYQNERRRVAMLRSKIDHLAELRMTELPKAVQNEHEACALDISELQWHCSYKGRQESRIKSRVDIAEVLHTRLKEDISFVKNHTPLIEEKLELEMDAMVKIKNARLQTNVELEKANERLAMTEAKSAEAHGKADMERAHIKKELNAVRDSLAQSCNELEEAERQHRAYIQLCDNARKKLTDNNNEMIVTQSTEENVRVGEKMESERIKGIRDQIIEAEFEHKKEADSNYRAQKEHDEREKMLKSEVTKLEHESRTKLVKLKALEKYVRDTKVEIETIQDKLKDCARQKVSDAKNMERMKKETVRVENQLGVTLEEHKKVETLYKQVKEKVMVAEDSAFGMEDSMQASADSLKKQLKAETHNRTVLQARIASSTTDLQKLKVEAKKKQTKLAKKVDEVDKAVGAILQQVEQLRKAHTTKQQTISNLKNVLEETQQKYVHQEKALNTQIDQMEPQLSNLSDKKVETLRKLDHIVHRTEAIEKKVLEVDRSANVVQRVIVKTKREIDELSECLEDITFQLETGEKIMEDLEQGLDEINTRISTQTEKHQAYIKERTSVFEELEEKKEKKLMENDRQGSRYQELQQKYLKMKDCMLNDYEARLKLESSIKDHKQLNVLQHRLHGALVEYYKYRGLFNQSELARFETVSTKNGEKVEILRENMGSAITNITKFLGDQVDGTAAHLVQAAAMSALKEPPQITLAPSEQFKASAPPHPTAAAAAAAAAGVSS